MSAVTPRLLVAEPGSRWVTGRNISVCGVTSGDHYVQSERRRKCRPIEIDGSRLLPYSFELMRRRKQGHRTTQPQCPLHFSPIKRKMPTLFSFQCAALCRSVCVCVCAPAVQFVYVETLEGRKVKGGELFNQCSLVFSVLWSLWCRYSVLTMQCRAQINKRLFKEAAVIIIRLFSTRKK